jgi:hypothetical protein
MVTTRRVVQVMVVLWVVLSGLMLYDLGPSQYGSVVPGAGLTAQLRGDLRSSISGEEREGALHPRAPVSHRATATAPIPGRVLTTHFYVMLMWSGVEASPGTARDGPVPTTGGEAVPPQRPPASATVTQPAPAPALSGVDIVAKIADGKDRDIMTKYGFNLRGAKVGWAWAGCGCTKGHYATLVAWWCPSRDTRAGPPVLVTPSCICERADLGSDAIVRGLSEGLPPRGQPAAGSGRCR